MKFSDGIYAGIEMLKIGVFNYFKWKKHWENDINFNIKQLESESNSILKARELGGRMPVFAEESLCNYLADMLPKICENARVYCPGKVSELEEKMVEVVDKVYSLEIK
jgi:hypothetical protein